MSPGNKYSADVDAVVVGAGPNGLAAAIHLRRQGLSVLLLEAEKETGGGMRTASLTLPGFMHDYCSAVHPLAAGSPFFNDLPLSEYGLEFVSTPLAAAHPLDDGSAGLLYSDYQSTAERLGADRKTYQRIIGTQMARWPLIFDDLMAPLGIPAHPFEFFQFGTSAILPALTTARQFTTTQGKALWAGMAAHSIQPLSGLGTSAFAMVLMLAAHHDGWPVARGGSSAIASALTQYFLSIGGELQTGFRVSHLSQLPAAKAVLFDLTPRQVLSIAGYRFSALYRWQLKRFRYGAGSFKVDWALHEPAPFRSAEAREAVTVHLGGSAEEIAGYESGIWQGQTGSRPFVLYVQPTLADPSRAPEGKHTAWAYCHVPHGSPQDMTAAIEAQVERFAPGFRDRILARHTMGPEQLEQYNNNYVGGDINGGSSDITQLFTRPALRPSPYRTSRKGVYLCSASTPPGGGVHGMAGFHAARQALKDIFDIPA